MSNKKTDDETQFNRSIDEEFSLGIHNINGRNMGYSAFTTDLGGMVCTKCHETIEEGQLAFVMNFGIESHRHPLSQVMRFTGLAWHAGGQTTWGKKHPVCLRARDLPGCENRDEIDEEFSRAISPGVCHRGSKSTH